MLTGETEVLGEKHYTASEVDEWMSVERWWNDTDRGKKCWEQNIILRRLETDEWVWSIGGMILTGETEVLGEKHYTASVVDEWMSMEHWWNDTDRGNWITGRKTLYSIGGRWMNEYGALVEWYWERKSDVLGEIPCDLATLFTRVLTRTELVFNPVLHGEKQASIRLCHGTADFEGKDGIQSMLRIKFNACRL